MAPDAREFGHGLRAALRVVRVEAPAAAPEPVSPELALVCPELRELAIAALPDRDPDGFLPDRDRGVEPARPTPAPLPEIVPASEVEAISAPSPPRDRPWRVALGAGAYLAVEAVHVAAFGALTMAGVAGVVTLSTYLNGL